MKLLKVGFVDYFEGMDQFFVDWLSKEYLVIRDDVNPDYLFFADETFGTRNRSMTAKKKIFYTGENRRPWDYQADHYITFDHFDSDKHYRLPLYVIDYWLMINNLGMETIDERYIARSREDIKSKTKFCAFISGNGVSPERNNAFHSLSTYKQVDAAGPLFNNIGYILPRGLEAARNKNEFLKPYKFNLCFENSQWPGYCTEKLFHALYMGTVPIYWGSPTAALDFNPKAFINWHDYLEWEPFYAKIMELDQNDEKYNEMYIQSLTPPNSPTNYFKAERFLRWFSQNVVGET
jgi:hypothetical protein